MLADRAALQAARLSVREASVAVEAATNVKAAMGKTTTAMQAETIAKRRAIDAIKDELMTKMALALETAANSETAAAEKKAAEVELKMDAAVDLKEALVQFESLVA